MTTLFDEFYPLSASIQTSGVWEINMVQKLENHLSKAVNGDREAESKLINRLGQIRRHVASFDTLSANLQDVIKKSVSWLRTIGRSVDFKNTDPGYWITARDGKTPRF